MKALTLLFLLLSGCATTIGEHCAGYFPVGSTQWNQCVNTLAMQQATQSDRTYDMNMQAMMNGFWQNAMKPRN